MVKSNVEYILGISIGKTLEYLYQIVPVFFNARFLVFTAGVRNRLI